ncbi:MAG: hypothetical protein V3V35_10855, partial [Dehalococcoidia bacterium]
VTILSFQLRVPIVDLKHADVDQEAVNLVPEDYARDHTILPVGFDPDGSLRVATMMPNDFQLSVQLSSMTGPQVKFALARAINQPEAVIAGRDAESPYGPLSGDTAVYVRGSPIGLDETGGPQVSESLQRPTGALEAPMTYEADFPVSDFVVNMGLTLRGA